MHRLAQAAPARATDAWLREIVAGVIAREDIISVDRKELWAMLDNIPAAILISTDRDCTRIVGNRAAQSMLSVGYGGNFSQSAPAEELPGFRVYDGARLVPPEELPMQVAAATGQRVAQSECEIRFDDGNTIHIAGHCIPISDEAGNICGSIGAFVDVTARKDQQDLADLIADEMSHRAKNSAALVLAIAQMTLREHLPRDIYARFEDRLMSISRLQALGYKDGWRTVSLVETVNDAVLPVAGRASGRVAVATADVLLASATAQNLGMILHELVTNACKYGALSGAAGRIEIGWTVHDDSAPRILEITWSETDGPPVTPPARTGFGSRLVTTLMRNLRGTVDTQYRPSGVRVELAFPI